MPWRATPVGHSRVVVVQVYKVYNNHAPHVNNPRELVSMTQMHSKSADDAFRLMDQSQISSVTTNATPGYGCLCSKPAREEAYEAVQFLHLPARSTGDTFLALIFLDWNIYDLDGSHRCRRSFWAFEVRLEIISPGGKHSSRAISNTWRRADRENMLSSDAFGELTTVTHRGRSEMRQGR